jgi:hypothetical protein
MMVHWALVMLGCWISVFAGYSLGRKHRVTTKVTKPDPFKEVVQHDWLARCEPLIQKLEEASLMPKGGTISPTNCKSMAILIDDMATQLDHTRHLVLHAKIKQDS